VIGVKNGGAHVQEGLRRGPAPTHLLPLVHAPGDDLVDRALHERGRDRLTAPAPGRVVDERGRIAREVAQELGDAPLQAADAGHVTQALALHQLWHRLTRIP
jgi:hypothetical protein